MTAVPDSATYGLLPKEVYEQRVKPILCEHGFGNIQNLGKVIGIKKTRIYSHLNGTSRMQIGTVEKIIEACGGDERLHFLRDYKTYAPLIRGRKNKVPVDPVGALFDEYLFRFKQGYGDLDREHQLQILLDLEGLVKKYEL